MKYFDISFFFCLNMCHVIFETLEVKWLNRLDLCVLFFLPLVYYLDDFSPSR